MSGASCAATPIGLLSAGLKEPVRLQLSGGQQNVDLRIQDISERFAANISEVFIDLLEIAAYVYCADQAVTRGDKTDRGLGANWRRRPRPVPFAWYASFRQGESGVGLRLPLYLEYSLHIKIRKSV
jgi:hypothetical protein